MIIKNLIFTFVFASFFACGLPGTGGGGGGDDFNGPAILALNANPQVIDAGEIIYTDVFIQEVHENGILLKFKYHYGLDYIDNTARLKTNKGEVSLRPTHNDRNDDFRYLTFFLEQSEFGSNKKGTVSFELLGRRRVNSGNYIEVDADIEDARKDNESEFSLDRPRFSTEDAISVRVEN